MSRMGVALLGTKSFGVAALEQIAKAGNVKVVIGDSKVVHRAEELNQRGMKAKIGVGHDKVDAYGWINALGAHVVVAAHWTTFVPKEVREATKYGVLCIHPSLLPRWRGINAVEWSTQDPIVGSTAFLMDDGLDTGPIVSQRWAHNPVPFAERGSRKAAASELWRECLFGLGLEVLGDALRKIERSVYTGVPLKPVPQDERFVTQAPAVAWAPQFEEQEV